MKYTVVIEKDESSHSAYVPDFLDCIVSSETCEFASDIEITEVTA